MSIADFVSRIGSTGQQTSEGSPLLSTLTQQQPGYIEDIQMTLLVRKQYDYLKLNHLQAGGLHVKSLSHCDYFSKRILATSILQNSQVYEELQILSKKADEIKQARFRFLKYSLERVNTFLHEHKHILNLSEIEVIDID